YRIDALATSCTQRFVAEGQGARVHYMARPKIANVLPLLVGSGSSQDARACGTSQLHRCQTDTTAGGVDQYRTVRRQSRAFVKGIIGREKSDRYRSRLCMAQV